MNKVKLLDIENIIWIIYIFFSIFGIIANNLEKEDIINKSNNNKKKYKTINIIIFFIAIIIYLYLLTITYKNYKIRRSLFSFLLLIANILFLIGGIIFLICEIFSNIIVPNEI